MSIVLSCDAGDQMTQAGATTYTYDANGNLTARGADTFTWDSANRLTGATVSGTSATMSYDGSHQMVAKTVGAATTRYVYDRNLAQAEMLTEGSTTYLYGRGMQNGFGPELEKTGGTRTYYDADALGSTRLATDAAGAVVGNSSYDAFGAPRAVSGTQSRFRFAGQEEHSDLGLVHMRARWYDPASGRFISRDPVVGSPRSPQSLNQYPYVTNDPVNRRDPSGLAAEGGGGCPGASGGGGSFGLGAGAAVGQTILNTLMMNPIDDNLLPAAGASTCWGPGEPGKPLPIEVPAFELPEREFGDGTLGGELAALFRYLGEIFAAATAYLGELAAFFQALPTAVGGGASGSEQLCGYEPPDEVGGPPEEVSNMPVDETPGWGSLGPIVTDVPTTPGIVTVGCTLVLVPCGPFGLFRCLVCASTEDRDRDRVQPIPFVPRPRDTDDKCEKECYDEYQRCLRDALGEKVEPGGSDCFHGYGQCVSTGYLWNPPWRRNRRAKPFLHPLPQRDELCYHLT